MPRTTNLVLTQEQETKLCEYIRNRKTSLEADNAERIKTDTEAWARYYLDVGRRKSDQGTIYPLSNLPLPVYAMVMEHFVSRCEDSTTGDKPYFHFEAVGVEGEEKALTYDRYFNWKLDDQGKVHEALQDAQLSLFIQSVSIQKATYTKQMATWIDRDKQILHDTSNGGAPVEIAGHGPIIQGEDQFVDQVDPVAAMNPGNPPEQLPTRKHLQADPSFILDPTRHVFAKPPDGIKRSEIIYAGPKSENVPFDRFLCPMNAESVDSADCVMEKQDKEFSWFADMWIERPWATWASVQPNLKAGDATQKVGQEGGLNVQNGKPVVVSLAFDTLNPVREVIECWIRRDVLGDGTMPPQEFVAFYDPKLNALVYYEWQARVCPDFKRPYTATAIGKVRNRWWGRSIWERGKPIFESIDRLFNGEFYRTIQQANPPKGGDPTVAVEEPESIGSDPTKYWELKKGKTMEELISYAKVPDTNARTQLVLEYMIFWIQLWLGISNLAQGDYQAVNTNATKYGIEKTLAEASMLGRRWIRRVISSFEQHLMKLSQIALATIPENMQETYRFTDGDRVKTAILAGAEIRQLQVQTNIVLSQNAQEKDIERCQAAMAAQSQYFGQLDPQAREAMRPLLIEVLFDLGFKDPEKLLPVLESMPVTKEMMGGAPMQMVNGRPVPAPPEGGGESESAKESISISYKDVPASVQRQMEKAAGFTPATESNAEIAAQKAKPATPAKK